MELDVYLLRKAQAISCVFILVQLVGAAQCALADVCASCHPVRLFLSVQLPGEHWASDACCPPMLAYIARFFGAEKRPPCALQAPRGDVSDSK